MAAMATAHDKADEAPAQSSEGNNAAADVVSPQRKKLSLWNRFQVQVPKNQFSKELVNPHRNK